MLSRFVIAFLPRSKHLSISWLQSPSTVILEPKKIKSLSLFSLFSHLFAMKWWGLMLWSHIFRCWVLSQLLHPHQDTISSSLSAIRVVSCAHPRLLTFLLAILISACDSSSLAFCMMYSAYESNTQSDNTQPSHMPLPILNQSVVPCLVLTVASWPAYTFLRRQVRWSGIPISWRIFHSLL